MNPTTIFAAVFALLFTRSLCLEADPKPISNVTVMGTVFCDACASSNFSQHSYFLEGEGNGNLKLLMPCFASLHALLLRLFGLLPGVKVRVQCVLRVNATSAGEMRVAVDRTTDRFGVYNLDILPVDGFECREGRGVDTFCQASLVESPSSLCDVPGLSSSTEHVALCELFALLLSTIWVPVAVWAAFAICTTAVLPMAICAASTVLPMAICASSAVLPMAIGASSTVLSLPLSPSSTEPTGAAAPALVPFAAASVFPALPPFRSISTGVHATLTASSPTLPIPTLSSLYSYAALVFATAFSSFTSSIIPLPTLPSLCPHSTCSYTTSTVASIIPLPSLYSHATCSYPTSTATSIIPFPVPTLPSLSSHSTCSNTATSAASIDPFPVPAFPSLYSNSTYGYATSTTSSTLTTYPSIFSFPISSIPTYYSISWGTIPASISLRNPRTRASLHPPSSCSKQP
ncbi:hypothetical protein B296_00047208 [Ensete ventricosum]|uniref:Pollen-specific protein-like n=1 Tax=Ensete ventricosum TaxID=4639 RepID=A0A426X944_ENSVE|nr:hypothetical protein B296_00047208 [Ensete ventricosum]